MSPGRVSETLSTIPLAPFLARKGGKIVSEGNPQTPGRGFTPLHSPIVLLGLNA